MRQGMQRIERDALSASFPLGDAILNRVAGMLFRLGARP
jgi:hypothetical protein